MGGQAELCDLCGAVVDADDARYNIVPDPTAHSSDPRFDGQRLVTACSEEHMRRLWDAYHSQPSGDHGEG